MPEPTVEQLRAEAHYHRDRLALYRARSFNARPTSIMRMREFERAAEQSGERLRRALAASRDA